ncbi:hypothetical protein E4U53_004404 [Claviceps sorghi]|nr:hypothetical protein E4U53_004404 [Claviceps sorghi]
MAQLALFRSECQNSAVEPPGSEELRRIYWDPTGNDETWETFVYNNRNGRTIQRDLGFTRATLVIGTIARRPIQYYESLHSHEKMTDGDVLMNADGRPAIQYAWIGGEGERFVGSFCVENMKIFNVYSRELAVFGRNL